MIKLKGMWGQIGLHSFIFSPLKSSKLIIFVLLYYIFIFNLFIFTYYVFSCSVWVCFHRTNWFYHVTTQYNFINSTVNMLCFLLLVFVVILTLIYYLSRILCDFILGYLVQHHFFLRSLFYFQVDLLLGNFYNLRI